MCKYWTNFTQCCGIINIFTSCSDGSFNNGPQFFSAGSLSFLENVGITETRYMMTWDSNSVLFLGC